MVKKKTPVAGIAYLCPLLRLSKTAEDELSPSSSFSHGIFLFSGFTMTFYLAFRGKWSDLSHGISGD
jgi:hypothetical protein